MSQLLARFGVKDHDRPAIEFVVKIVSVYAVWKIFQFTVDHIPALLSIWQKGTDFYAHKIATLANKIFVAMGYDVSFYYYKAVFIIGTPGFMVEEHCIAIPATLIFGAFIAIYKGPIKHKYWYIPLGMIAVQATNFIRIFGLALLLRHAPLRYFDFNHSVTGLIFEYTTVFLMIALWMRKYHDWEPEDKAGSKTVPPSISQT